MSHCSRLLSECRRDRTTPGNRAFSEVDRNQTWGLARAQVYDSTWRSIRRKRRKLTQSFHPSVIVPAFFDAPRRNGRAVLFARRRNHLINHALTLVLWPL